MLEGEVPNVNKDDIIHKIRQKDKQTLRVSDLMKHNMYTSVKQNIKKICCKLIKYRILFKHTFISRA